MVATLLLLSALAAMTAASTLRQSARDLRGLDQPVGPRAHAAKGDTDITTLHRLQVEVSAHLEDAARRRARLVRPLVLAGLALFLLGLGAAARAW